MKKRFLTAAAFFLSAAMLAACGNGSEASSSETAAPTEAAQESGAEADADGGNICPGAFPDAAVIQKVPDFQRQVIRKK